MSNSIIGTPATSGEIDVRKLSSQQLLIELGRAISMTAEALARLAACWVELERRGEDLSTLKVGLAHYLQPIASGKLAPEAVVAFAGRRLVLRWLESLPLEDQRRFAQGEPVRLIERDGTERFVPVSDIDARDIAHLTVGSSILRQGKPRQRRGRMRSSYSCKILSVRIREDDYELLRDQATKAGISLPDHVRALLKARPTSEE